MSPALASSILKLALGTAGLRSAALAAYFLGTTPVVGARERKIRSEK